MNNFQSKSLLIVAILSFVTCGIYLIYWVYITTNDINNYMQQEYMSPSLATILSIVTCGLFLIYWFYKYGTIVFNDMSKKANLDSYGESAAVLAILFLVPFGYVYSVIALQNKLNIIYNINNSDNNEE